MEIITLEQAKHKLNGQQEHHSAMVNVPAILSFNAIILDLDNNCLFLQFYLLCDYVIQRDAMN